MNRRVRWPVLLLAPLLACESIEELIERPRGATPHERYADALRIAGLADAALARDWLGAASASVRSAHDVAAPFEEAGYLPPERPTAVSWSVSLQRGQRVRIEADLDGDHTSRFFLDVFELTDDTTREPRLVAWADSAAVAVEFETRRTGRYVVRLQPELLRGGRYRVRIVSGASLSFPVSGRAVRDIGSRFGAPRDGGRRQHHGVDIFAPRGTPVVAATDAVVTRVRETPVGGKVVWLRDERRNQSLYYAHLDAQLVEAGQRLAAGDTLGLVGNTGNAVSTPPHLHFGIYARGEGPVDPYPFLYDPPGRAPPLVVDTTRFDRWARVRPSQTELRAGPADDARAVARLAAHTAVRVEGGSGTWFRIRLPGGETGYVASATITGLDEPLEDRRVTETLALRAAPDPAAPVIDEVAGGSELQVLAHYGGFALVRNGSVSHAWTSSL
jgi:peptidoglycan LD-endopeptidase LytH